VIGRTISYKPAQPRTIRPPSPPCRARTLRPAKDPLHEHPIEAALESGVFPGRSMPAAGRVLGRNGIQSSCPRSWVAVCAILANGSLGTAWRAAARPGESSLASRATRAAHGPAAFTTTPRRHCPLRRPDRRPRRWRPVRSPWPSVFCGTSCAPCSARPKHESGHHAVGIDEPVC